MRSGASLAQGGGRPCHAESTALWITTSHPVFYEATFKMYCIKILSFAPFSTGLCSAPRTAPWCCVQKNIVFPRVIGTDTGSSLDRWVDNNNNTLERWNRLLSAVPHATLHIKKKTNKKAFMFIQVYWQSKNARNKIISRDQRAVCAEKKQFNSLIPRQTNNFVMLSNTWIQKL